MAIDDQMEYERQLYIKKEMDKEDGRREKVRDGVGKNEAACLSSSNPLLRSRRVRSSDR